MTIENMKLTAANKLIIDLNEQIKKYADDIEASQFSIADPLTAEEFMNMTPHERITLHFKWLLISEKYCHAQHRRFNMEQSITKLIIYDIKKQVIYKECLTKSEISDYLHISEKYVDYLLRIGTKVCFSKKALGNKYRIFKQDFTLAENGYTAIKTPNIMNNLNKLKQLIEGAENN